MGVDHPLFLDEIDNFAIIKKALPDLRLKPYRELQNAVCSIAEIQ